MKLDILHSNLVAYETSYSREKNTLMVIGREHSNLLHIIAR
jgi:hypothetical protein